MYALMCITYINKIHKLFDVSRNCFFPKPNVDSTVVCMELKKDRLFVKDMEFFKRLVKDCFKYKRKNLRNNLVGYDLDKVGKVLDKYGLNLNDRAESLSLEIFVEIANELV